MEAEHRKVSSPYGFSMYDVAATENLQRLSRAAQEIISKAGFERIMPAMVDYPETFSENSHAEMFSFKDNSGERLALRNDVTAQVIKGYVRQLENRTGQSLRKFYYAAPVYKDVRKNYPLPREIYQIGCEVVGEGAEKSLPELLLLSHKLLKEVLKVESAVALSDINLREPFAALLGKDYVAAESRRDAPRLAELLKQKAKLDEAQAKQLSLWLFYPAPGQAMPGAAKGLPGAVSAALASAEGKIRQHISALDNHGINAFWQPLTEPRSSYYSGVFFETYVKGFTEPLVRGGVYNDLIKRYADVEAGACGFALDLLTR